MMTCLAIQPFPENERLAPRTRPPTIVNRRRSRSTEYSTRVRIRLSLLIRC